MAKASPIFVRNLTGHSGCRLSLYRNGDGMFVRKLSSDLGYNKRLEFQYRKQCLFDREGFSVPRVLGRGYDADGLFYFDMEFINCQSMAKHFNTIRMGDISAAVDFLFKNLPFATAKQTDSAVQAISKKIAELESKITDPSASIAAALQLLSQYDFSQVPQSDCHGDLTLENIMITERGKIYLIDLLDSFFDSWVVDVAKILQDVDLHWSYRHEKMDANLELHLLVAKEEIFSRVLAMHEGTRTLLDIYHMLLLNVLRIFPYTKDEKTLTFLDAALQKTLNQIKKIKEMK